MLALSYNASIIPVTALVQGTMVKSGDAGVVACNVARLHRD
jgi:hypothetical protein